MLQAGQARKPSAHSLDPNAHSLDTNAQTLDPGIHNLGGDAQALFPGMQFSFVAYLLIRLLVMSVFHVKNNIIVISS